MFSAIRKRVTFANVAMTLALVFAMTGGAYAAKKYLITSTKQISPKVLKSLQGKAGAQGPAGHAGPQGSPGAQGPAGAAGKDGAPGANGKDGANGESVASSTLKAGEEGCKEGGSKFVVGAKTTTACNGEKGAKGAEGNPWTPNGTLPSEATETGTWSFGPETREGLEIRSIASFPIPLAKAFGEKEVHIIEGTATAECPGNSHEPAAAPGNFCLYVEYLQNATVGYVLTSGETVIGTGKAGAFAYLNLTGVEAEGVGSWAVTAE